MLSQALVQHCIASFSSALTLAKQHSIDADISRSRMDADISSSRMDADLPHLLTATTTVSRKSNVVCLCDTLVLLSDTIHYSTLTASFYYFIILTSHCIRDISTRTYELLN